MAKVKGNHMLFSQAYPLYSMAMAAKKAHSNHIKKEGDPNQEDDYTRILRDAYWNSLEAYVKLDDLKFQKDPKALITVLELECGEALEARTLCAYLKRGKHRFEEAKDFFYYGIENDLEMIKIAKESYKKNNPVLIPLIFTKKYNFLEQIPDYLPEIAVLAFNNLDCKNRPESEWKQIIGLGMECLRKDGIIISTLNWTGNAPAFRHIIGEKCNLFRDRKNLFAPKEYPETYDHIIVGKKR